MIQRIPLCLSFLLALILGSAERLEGQKMNQWNQFRLSANNAASVGETEIQKPKKLWSFATGEVVESSPAVWQDLVIIGGHSKNLHGVDLTTGKVRWTFATGGWVRSSPSVVDENDRKRDDDDDACNPGRLGFVTPTIDLVCQARGLSKGARPYFCGNGQS